MKKFIYAITIALAALVLFASCENSFSGTKLNTAPLRESVASGRTNNNKGFKISSANGTLKNTKNQVITIKANGAVDWNTLNDALSIYPLSDATDFSQAYVRGSAIGFTLQAGSTEKEATILVDLSAIVTNRIELVFDATKLTGPNGNTKLNQDEDRYQGEAKEDDYIAYIDVDRYNAADPVEENRGLEITALKVGEERNPQRKLAVFGKAFTDENGIIDGFKMTIIPVRYEVFTDPKLKPAGKTEEKLVDTTDYKALFDAALVFEAYDPATNKWNKITTNKTTWGPTYNKTTSSWDDSSLNYVVEFAAQPDGTNVRVRIEGAENIKSSVDVFGYSVRFDLDSDLSKYVYEEDASKDTRTLKYTVLTEREQEDVFDIDYEFDTYGYNGRIILDFKTADMLFYEKVNMGAFGATHKIVNFKYTAANDILKNYKRTLDLATGAYVEDSEFGALAHHYGTRYRLYKDGDGGDRYNFELDEESGLYILEGAYYYNDARAVCDYKSDQYPTWITLLGSGGIDTSTLTTDNIKIAVGGKFIDIVAITSEFTSTSNEVPTRIVLKLPENYKKTGLGYTLYLGPGLKSSGGKDESATIDIPAKSFGNIENINEAPYGFTKIDKNW